jgi:hypothetical protein
MISRRFPLFLLGLSTVSLAVGWVSTSVVGADSAPADPAVDRARREVKMLDDLYKTAVVQITTHYVDGIKDVSAGTAAKLLFAAMKKNGWHEVRLLDATGKPLVDENVANDEFEKAAVAALVAGKPSPEAIVTKDGKRYLRIATPIPVVMEKCTMCHDNYVDNKGVIGVLGYTVPIQD